MVLLTRIYKSLACSVRKTLEDIVLRYRWSFSRNFGSNAFRNEEAHSVPRHDHNVIDEFIVYTRRTFSNR